MTMQSRHPLERVMVNLETNYGATPAGIEETNRLLAGYLGLPPCDFTSSPDIVRRLVPPGWACEVIGTEEGFSCLLRSRRRHGAGLRAFADMGAALGGGVGAPDRGRAQRGCGDRPVGGIRGTGSNAPRRARLGAGERLGAVGVEKRYASGDARPSTGFLGGKIWPRLIADKPQQKLHKRLVFNEQFT
jgi:hypothetical protein